MEKINKFYTLYNDSAQSKLLTTTQSLETLQEETEYYTSGTWFEYDKKEGSTLIYNEKEIKGTKFPKEAKKREYREFNNSKWII